MWVELWAGRRKKGRGGGGGTNEKKDPAGDGDGAEDTGEGFMGGEGDGARGGHIWQRGGFLD